MHRGHPRGALSVVGLARAEVSMVKPVVDVAALEHVEPVPLLLDGAGCERIGLG